jgi:hypothetical protein
VGGIGYQEMRIVSFLYDRGRVRPVLPFLPRGAGAVGSLGYPRERAIVYQFNRVHVIEMTWLSVNHIIAYPCSLEVNIMHHVCDTRSSFTPSWFESKRLWSLSDNTAKIIEQERW